MPPAAGSVRVVTSAFCYNFVQSFLALNAFYPSYMVNITAVNVLLVFLLLTRFLHLFFTSNSIVFVDRGRKNFPCPRAQGTVATPLLSDIQNC